jgi:hypothetical protein
LPLGRSQEEDRTARPGSVPGSSRHGLRVSHAPDQPHSP